MQDRGPGVVHKYDPRQSTCTVDSDLLLIEAEKITEFLKVKMGLFFLFHSRFGGRFPTSFILRPLELVWRQSG